MTVKVVVAANNVNKDYELNREQPLRAQVTALCGLFNITANIPEYTLQFNTSGVYISDEVFLIQFYGLFKIFIIA